MSTYLILNNTEKKVNLYLSSSFIEPLKEILEIYQLSYNEHYKIDNNSIQKGKERIKEKKEKLKRELEKNIFLLENTIIEWFDKQAQNLLCNNIKNDFNSFISNLEENKEKNKWLFIKKDENWFIVEEDDFYENIFLNNEKYKNILEQISLLANVFSNYSNKYNDKDYVYENLEYYLDEYITYYIIDILIDLIKKYQLTLILN